MKGLEFFINRGYMVTVEHGTTGLYCINIVMEADSQNRVVRGIEISKEQDNFFFRCYEDFGQDGYGAQYLSGDELAALSDFISEYKAQQDTMDRLILEYHL